MAAPLIDPLKPGTWTGVLSTLFGAVVGSGPYKGTPHNGIDLPAKDGTPVYAATEGTVTRVDSNDPGGGLIVEVWNPDKGIKTQYAHLSKADVHVGQYVSQGIQIAEVGHSGDTTGPHLHFGVAKCAVSGTGGRRDVVFGLPVACSWVNPIDYLPGLNDTPSSAYKALKATVDLQPDGKCPVGYHENNGKCEVDSGIGAGVAGVVQGVTGWAAALGTILGFLLDPMNWVRIFAMVAGAALVLVGGRWVYQAT